MIRHALKDASETCGASMLEMNLWWLRWFDGCTSVEHSGHQSDEDKRQWYRDKSGMKWTDITELGWHNIVLRGYVIQYLLPERGRLIAAGKLWMRVIDIDGEVWDTSRPETIQSLLQAFYIEHEPTYERPLKLERRAVMEGDAVSHYIFVLPSKT